MLMMNYSGCGCAKYHAPSFVCDAIRSAAKRDPTRTGAIRRDLASQFEQRWHALRRLTRQALMEQDIFGMAALSAQGIYAAALSGGQVQAFQAWMDAALLNAVVGRDSSWLTPWMQRAYAMGVDSAEREMGQAVVMPYGRADSIATLAFVELQGIAEAVSQQTVREVANGLARGERPATVARMVIARISATGSVRARALANTSVVMAHTAGTLDALEMAGVSTVAVVPEAHPVRITGDAARRRPPGPKRQGNIERAERRLERLRKVEVITAGDDAVCVKCERIAEAGPYSINRARQLIPAHPNCRCLFIPYRQRFVSVEAR